MTPTVEPGVVLRWGSVSGRWRRPGVVLATVVAAPLLLFVAYPILWLALAALGVPHELTFDHVAAVVTNPTNYAAVKNTLILAFSVGVGSTVLGVPLAWATASTNMPFRTVIHALMALTFILPPYLTALAYIILLGPNAGQLNRLIAWTLHLPRGPLNIFSMQGVIFVISLHGVTFVYFLTTSAFRSLNNSAIEAARVLGAPRAMIARRIVLPLIAPAITGGALLAALESCTLFGPQAFLGLPASILFLPTRIWGAFNAYPPRLADAAAMSFVLILLAAGGLYAQQRLVRSGSFVTITGRPEATVYATLSRAKWGLLAFCLLVVFFSALAPLEMLVQAAVCKVWTNGLVPANLTLSNFVGVMSAQNGIALRGLVNSLELAVGAATIASILGLLIAYLDLRTDIPGRRSLDYLATVPISIPGNALAIGLIMAFIRPPLPIYGTAWILLVAYVVAFMPKAVRCADAALRQIDPTLEEAARITGGSWPRMMRTVLVPLIRPGLLTGWLLVFIPALTELSATILLYSSGNETISVAIFRLNDVGRLEDVAALAVITVGVVLVASLALQWLTERSAVVRRRHETAPQTGG